MDNLHRGAWRIWRQEVGKMANLIAGDGKDGPCRRRERRRIKEQTLQLRVFDSPKPLFRSIFSPNSSSSPADFPNCIPYISPAYILFIGLLYSYLPTVFWIHIPEATYFKSIYSKLLKYNLNQTFIYFSLIILFRSTVYINLHQPIYITLKQSICIKQFQSICINTNASKN